MSESVPRIGVIGTGHWGRNHLRNFDALGALAAFSDTRSASVEEFSKTYPKAVPFADPDALLRHTPLDGVVIASPAATHGELVRKALNAGKHVFVEKPLCLDVAEAMALRDDARRRGRILMVGHLLLYHPGFLAVKRIVKAGNLGKLRYIYSNRLSLGKIRREENALWSFAPHDISMILALTGAMPTHVMATGGNYLDDRVADTTLSHLTFADGVQAHVFVSWLHPYKEQKLVVIGGDAMAVFDDTRPAKEKVLLYRHAVGWSGELPVVTRAEAEAVPFDDSEPLRLECQAFLTAMQTGTPPPSDADEGVRVLQVLQACQRMLAAGPSAKLEHVS